MSEGNWSPEGCEHGHLDVWYGSDEVLVIECDDCDTRWTWPVTWQWTNRDNSTAVWCSEGMA